MALRSIQQYLQAMQCHVGMVMQQPLYFTVKSSRPHSASFKVFSKNHPRCVAGRAAPLPAAFQRQAAANRSSEESDMIITFNTAYNIAKEELPFTKCKSEIILMKKNGLNVNPTYSNDTACAQFIGVIADNLTKKTGVQIADSTYMSFLRGMPQLRGIF
ncbi:hypothetical protein AAFF_G00015890 [Aldrovandia affinis]|uniref:Uncharacterized protein n=1 Tax=Aldrovandia affinis TaxID=143900 RepID=A0AAD7VY72_9TELE|nr:hypothetical protein AAFF_G00015890 [Aldrovandia affinis]